MNDNVGAAAALLLAQGFTKREAARIAEETTLEQIEAAIANADHLASEGKLESRTGYIITAIREEYPLLEAAKRVREKAERDRDRRRREAAEQAEEKRALAAARALNDETDRIKAYIETLSPERQEGLRDEAMEQCQDPEICRWLRKRETALWWVSVRRAIYPLIESELRERDAMIETRLSLTGGR